MGVKIGRSHIRKSHAEGVSRTVCWERCLGPRGTRWQGNDEDCKTRSFMICTPHRLFGWSNQEKRDGRGMWHVRETEEVRSVFWWWDPKERVHLEDLGVDGSITLKWIAKKWDGEWTGLSGSGYGQVVGDYECGFHNMRVISWLVKDLLSSRRGLCSVS